MNVAWQRWASTLFFLIAGGFLALGAYFRCAPIPDPEPTLEVDTDVIVTSGVAGTKQRVSLPFYNRTSKPMRILGMYEC